MRICHYQLYWNKLKRFLKFNQIGLYYLIQVCFDEDFSFFLEWSWIIADVWLTNQLTNLPADMTSHNWGFRHIRREWTVSNERLEQIEKRTRPSRPIRCNVWIVERMRYPTDRPTNWPTDTASYRGALSHLKRPAARAKTVGLALIILLPTLFSLTKNLV